jgi:hypothetical protein
MRALRDWAQSDENRRLGESFRRLSAASPAIDLLTELERLERAGAPLDARQRLWGAMVNELGLPATPYEPATTSSSPPLLLPPPPTVSTDDDRPNSKPPPPRKDRGMADRWIYEEMAAAPSKVGDRTYARSLWERRPACLRGIKLKTFQNIVANYRYLRIP